MKVVRGKVVERFAEEIDVIILMIISMRRLTKQVKIGEKNMGSEHPVLVQSMLNTDTMDTESCVEQAIRIIETGGELVRITAPGVREAENLKNIRAGLWERGYQVPLSADIHFTPDAAMFGH